MKFHQFSVTVLYKLLLFLSDSYLNTKYKMGYQMIDCFLIIYYKEKVTNYYDLITTGKATLLSS